jgi:hypothetical protein
MNEGFLAALAATAATVGSLHSLAPDHWLPFAALARAQGWSAARTARVTALCGLGHVTSSVLLGLLGLAFGVGLFEAFGQRLETMAGVLLAGFGLVYGAWGLRQAAGERFHGHAHAHYDHVHAPGTMTTGSLFLLFSADPCVAVIPLLAAAASRGAAAATTVVLVFEVATIGTMVGIVLAARAGVTAFRVPWLDRWGHAAAGGLIAALGIAAVGLGW